MFSEDGKLVWAAQYRTWGAVHKIWQADNDNDIRGPYPPPIRGNLAFKYDTVEAQAAQTCPIRFQGQWEDAETGLYYNRFRYYDPLAAQYISSDPIGLAGSLRPNGYVHNPNAWIDPLGLASYIWDPVKQRWEYDGKATLRPDTPEKLVRDTGRINQQDIDAWAQQGNPQNVFTPGNGQFGNSGFKYSTNVNGTEYKIWGHGPNSAAPAGSFSRTHGTATIKKMSSGQVYIPGSGWENAIAANLPSRHIPLD